MGAAISFCGRVALCRSQPVNISGIKSLISDEISQKDIDLLVEDSEFKCLQMSETIPESTLRLLNEQLFTKRQDVEFRVFGFWGGVCNLSFLKSMNNLTNLSIDGISEVENIEVLTELPNLKQLQLNIYSLLDYSFLKEINPQIKHLGLSVGGSTKKYHFDCEWLVRFTQLETLYLGKAKKNICALENIPSLRQLTLRGITCGSLDFLMKIPLEKLAVHLGAMDCFSSLQNHPTLQEIELWKISRLEDIQFLTALPKLRRLHLCQLPHIMGLPEFPPDSPLEEIDIDECKNFRDIHAVAEMKNLRNIRLIADVSEEEIEYALKNPGIRGIEYYCGGVKQRDRVRRRMEACGKIC